MRVLQIGKFYPISGGVEKVMYDITMGLSQKQVYCDMLCASAEKQDQGNLLLNDYARVLCVPTWKKVAATMLSPAMIFRLRKIGRNMTSFTSIILIRWRVWHCSCPVTKVPSFCTGIATY